MAWYFGAEKRNWQNRMLEMGKDGIMVSRILDGITFKSGIMEAKLSQALSRSQGKIRTKEIAIIWNLNLTQ